MTSGQHDVVKPNLIIGAAVEALREQSSLSAHVTRDSYERYGGDLDDTVTVRVEGSLPVRTMGWRSDRTQPIVTDEYSETTVTMKINRDHPYSALKLTDEAKQFDFGGTWGTLFNKQMDALARWNDANIARQILNAPYERRIVVDNTPATIEAQAKLGRDPIFNAIADAKRALKLMRAPGANYVAVCGSNFAYELTVNQKLSKNQGIGDVAFDSGTLGTYAGVTFIEDPAIPADDAYLYLVSGFVFWNAAPPLPTSAPFSASASANGYALRWIMDYDTGFVNDRSLFDMWTGQTYTQDVIEVEDENGRPFTSDELFFTRGVHLRLASSSDTADFEKAPGDGGTDTPGGATDSFLAYAYNREKYDSADVGPGEPFPGVLNVPGVVPAETGDEGDDEDGESGNP